MASNPSVLGRDCGELVERYLLRLRVALSGAPEREREDILAEIRSHIVERLEDGKRPLDALVPEILNALGDPETLAAGYQYQGLLKRASRTRSPWIILRATLQWAMTGVKGFIALMLLFVGYVAGAGFYVCALLKPIFPRNIGLWWESPMFGMGFRPTADLPARELLGPWLPLVALVLGSLCIIASTRFVRTLIRKFSAAKRA